MAVRQNNERLDRSDFNGVARALIISLALHTLVFGGYQAGQRFGWFRSARLPAWLQRVQQAVARIHPVAKPLAPLQPQQPPLMFVEVNPSVAVAEPPKNAKYYSSRSSRAANREADEDSNTPKISGNQELVPHTENTPRSKPQPLQPSPASSQQNDEPEAKLRPAQTLGDLAFAKPAEQLHTTDGQADVERPRPKPRTLAEAQARLAAANSMPGQMMKQAGGVRPRAIQSSLDVTATPFGEYDAAVIAAIQARWYALIDDQPLTRTTGKVMLSFHLNYDGRITDMTVQETTVGELLTAMCQRAVLDPAPYGVWPSDMRRMIGANFRDVTFTFYYY